MSLVEGYEGGWRERTKLKRMWMRDLIVVEVAIGVAVVLLP